MFMIKSSAMRFLWLTGLFPAVLFGQQVQFGANNYIEYQAGTLPIVISVPHGGNLTPASIPDRTCNNPVFATDFNTIETALEIKNALFSLTGCYPHLVICHLKRSKLDCNRRLSDAACGQPEAVTAWNEFHDFIATARDAANQAFQFRTFFIDLHGHGNPIQRIELGYLLYDDELALPDSQLNTNKYLNLSSIKNLALSNVNQYTHAQLLRGAHALGTLLGNESYPSVPSQQIPAPGTTTNYYSGGYITANHTCYAPGVQINGVQMELNHTGVRNTAANRTLFAAAFARVMVEYLGTHFQMDWGPCSAVASSDPVRGEKVHWVLAPNPSSGEQEVQVRNFESGELEYEVFSSVGQRMARGTLHPDYPVIMLPDAPPGTYVVKLTQVHTQAWQALKWEVGE